MNQFEILMDGGTAPPTIIIVLAVALIVVFAACVVAVGAFHRASLAEARENQRRHSELLAEQKRLRVELGALSRSVVGEMRTVLGPPPSAQRWRIGSEQDVDHARETISDLPPVADYDPEVSRHPTLPSWRDTKREIGSGAEAPEPTGFDL